MNRYFIELSYKGTNYNGWQVQANTPNTIQQVLTEKLSMYLKEIIEITGCGRTDTGVHAKNYFAHFDYSGVEIKNNLNQCLYKLNTILPNDIGVQNIFLVKETAHARFDARSRTYHYFLHQKKNPFIEESSWYQYGEIDFTLMNKAAEILLSTTDFTSFSKLNTQVKNNNCWVKSAQWKKINENEWCFEITAARFLRNMVRAIVGTLLLVGRNKINIEDFKKIIEQKNRTEAGMSVPAHGLFLVNIIYPSELFL